MITDTTFFTNEPGATLLDRFKKTLKDTQYFDILVGYFRTSGFHQLYESFESIDKIRILVGLNVDRRAYEIIETSRSQRRLEFESHSKTKDVVAEATVREMEYSEDSDQTEIGIRKFLEFLITDCPNKEEDIKNGGNGKKLEFRAYPNENIHAKVYISRFHPDDRDFGSVITGSSNFSESGLVTNREFNVELKNRADVEFARQKFEELWKDAVDISHKYLETITGKTWLNDTITPYELYLKYLYEYLKEKINIDHEGIFGRYVPHGFIDLEYQREAVKDARSKLGEYGGVFLSDVVGLGKTYISAMLAQQLDGRNLIICPPVLIAYWQDTFSDFRVPADVVSIGQLDKVIEKGTKKYKNIFIDEAHRFRNETNQTYDKLKQICWGKRVILISATPQNNTPLDLLSQIKLFQKGHQSTIPNLKDIERYFHSLQKKLKDIDRQSDFARYISIIKENSKIVREYVLKYLMVRRTRREIEEWFSKDLENHKVKFPQVAKPNKVFYEFDEETESIFNQTIEKIKEFRYARYTPILYLKHPDSEEEVGQRNLRRFMKILLVKRLESSFFAFKNTVARFISSYERFLGMCAEGTVYLSKKYTEKIFEMLDNDDEDEIMRLVEEEKIRQYKISEFKDDYVDNLTTDLQILREIEFLWKGITDDPKIKKFKKILAQDKILKENKIIVFTESKETAEYLEGNLRDIYKDAVISYSSKSSAAIADKIIENYDPNHKHPKDEIRVLISTEVLSEGVNLHRSNVVVNYDFPWNPTRVIQRVGRINRVDTAFDDIYIYNFFPTVQSNNEIKLEEAAIGKIQSFHNMLGEDSAYLTDGEEVSSYELFNRINSKKVIEGEDEEEDSELRYLAEIRAIRDKNPDLFERIKHLPKKARSAKVTQASCLSNLHKQDANVTQPSWLRDEGHKQDACVTVTQASCLSSNDAVLTFFRKDKLRKIFITDNESTKELDFFQAANILRSMPGEKREKLRERFYEYFNENKKGFELATIEEISEFKQKGGKAGEIKLIHIIKAIQKLKGWTEDDEEYLKKVLNLLEEGILPKQTTKTIIKNIGKEINHLKIYGIIRRHVPDTFFAMPVAELAEQGSGQREVILSEYLVPVTQASCLRNESAHKQDANVTQPSWLRDARHKQDACVTGE